MGILLYLIVKHFLKPVHVLTASAEAVGRGDLSHRTKVRTPDELGLLAASFNRMVEKLERTTVSRAYVDGILSSMADSVIVLDSEWRIRTVNRSACDLLGAEEAELISRPLTAIFECAQECEMAAVLTGSAITNREACLRTSGGGRIPVLFSAALMQQGHHEARLVMTVRDITELNQMKNELARARDTALASTRHKQSRGSDSDVPGWSRRIKPLRRADLAEIVGGGRESGELAESRPDADCVPLRPGLHALVVEDNPVNQRVITGLLKKKGYRVTVAASGEESDARRANALSSF